MTDERATNVDEGPAGCGVQGCLTAAVALFVILLIGLAIIAVIRFSSPPQPRYGGVGPAIGDPAALSAIPLEQPPAPAAPASERGPRYNA